MPHSVYWSMYWSLFSSNIFPIHTILSHHQWFLHHIPPVPSQYISPSHCLLTNYVDSPEWIFSHCISRSSLSQCGHHTLGGYKDRCRKVQIVTVSSSTPSQHFSSINIVPVSTSRGRLHDEGFIVRGGIPRESGHDTHTTEQSQAVLGRMEPSRVTSILLFEWDRWSLRYWMVIM